MPESPAGSRGLFLVLDGIDGCGKSTQAAMLAAALARERRIAPLHLREPGSTPVGERLRELLLSREHELEPGVEALLFAAARRQMLAKLVEPALAAGRDVVCERFHASTFAYQGVAGAVGEERVLDLLDAWAGEPRPDLVVVLDLEPELALERRGRASDRIEDKGLEFQRRVAEGFRRYAVLSGAALVAAGGTPDEVAREVLAQVRRVL